MLIGIMGTVLMNVLRVNSFSVKGLNSHNCDCNETWLEMFEIKIQLNLRVHKIGISYTVSF